jgi:hypothetical protein
VQDLGAMVLEGEFVPLEGVVRTGIEDGFVKLLKSNALKLPLGRSL